MRVRVSLCPIFLVAHEVSAFGVCFEELEIVRVRDGVWGRRVDCSIQQKWILVMYILVCTFKLAPSTAFSEAYSYQIILFYPYYKYLNYF